MRVLWITNQATGYARKKYNLHFPSGTWLEPTLFDLSQKKDIDIYVASVMPISEYDFILNENIHYCCIPQYKTRFKSSNMILSKWKRVLDIAKPDLIMIWGTECTYGLFAMRAAPSVPAVIFIQGIIASVSSYYLGGLSYKEIIRSFSFRNLIKRNAITMCQHSYRRKAVFEKRMIDMAKNVIVENEWARANCRMISPQCHFYEYRMNINASFMDLEWSLSQCSKYTLFCTAPGGYPIKGFHQLLKALALIKRVYPNVHLRVPGMNDPFNLSCIETLWQDGYIKFLKYLIDKLDLRSNITFLGRLDSYKIGKELLNAHVFIASSCIENQSASLREAMVVGTPSIASFSGGMPESIHDSVDGRLYRFEEYSQLAEQVILIFKDDNLALHYSHNARKSMRDYLSDKSDSNTLVQIYKEILDDSMR